MMSAEILTEAQALKKMAKLIKKRPEMAEFQRNIEYLLSYEESLKGRMSLLFGMISKRNLSTLDQTAELTRILNKKSKFEPD